MSNCSNHKNKRHKVFSFVLLLLFITTGMFSQAQQYQLNDPRNPDCPCHKAQKQAELEYVQLNLSIGQGRQDTEKELPVINTAAALKSNVAESSFATTDVAVAAGKSRHKNKTSRFRKIAFRYFRKNRGIKKIHTDYSVCFHNW